MGASKSTDISKNSAINYFIFAHKKRVLYIPIVLLILILVVKNSTNKYSLFPLQKHLTIYKQLDSSQNGNSQVTLDTEDSKKLSVSYTLREGYQWPYAGVGISTIDSAKNDSSGVDLSKYDYLHVKMASTSPKKMTKIYFTTFVKNFTDMRKDMSWRVYEHKIPTTEKIEKHRIYLKTFETPDWWYTLNKTTPVDVGKRDFSNCLSFVVENSDSEEKDQKVDITIEEIYLSQNLTAMNIVIVILLIMYSVIYYYLVNFGLRKFMSSGPPVVIPYHQLDVASYADEDAVRIEEFVANNYSNQELLVKDVSRKTGVTQTKIQVILKNKFQMSFRQYLNTIRTYEAKRLLRETDRQVTDIAYRVGYKNVTHFNRIFKDSEGVSPNQYRKKSNTK